MVISGLVYCMYNSCVSVTEVLYICSSIDSVRGIKDVDHLQYWKGGFFVCAVYNFGFVDVESVFVIDTVFQKGCLLSQRYNIIVSIREPRSQ